MGVEIGYYHIKFIRATYGTVRAMRCATRFVSQEHGSTTSCLLNDCCSKCPFRRYSRADCSAYPPRPGAVPGFRAQHRMPSRRGGRYDGTGQDLGRVLRLACGKERLHRHAAGGYHACDCCSGVRTVVRPFCTAWSADGVCAALLMFRIRA